jgi:hypothetical protein
MPFLNQTRTGIGKFPQVTDANSLLHFGILGQIGTCQEIAQ